MCLNILEELSLVILDALFLVKFVSQGLQLHLILILHLTSLHEALLSDSADLATENLTELVNSDTIEADRVTCGREDVATLHGHISHRGRWLLHI